MSNNGVVKEYKRIRNGKAQIVKATQRGVIKEFICKGCGIMFSVKGNRSTRKFHSRKCYEEDWKKRLPGHNRGERGKQVAWNKDKNMQNNQSVRKNRDSMTITVQQQFDSGERRVFTGRVFHMNKLEKQLAERLDFDDIVYIFSYPLVLEQFTTFVDFFVPNSNVCIYIDGEYWHSKEDVKRRDKEINKVLLAKKFILLRFSGKEIKENLDSCMYSIRSEIIPPSYDYLS